MPQSAMAQTLQNESGQEHSVIGQVQVISAVTQQEGQSQSARTFKFQCTLSAPTQGAAVANGNRVHI
eukprot:scaffold193163_cov27-Tisochrysis_lutea.AAC.1